uniref:VWFA domain-containing protein n=1 Tax=Heterorhabditis bacteriophora TaxID=37862 RepID=A0A1I7XBT9_HETBA
MYYRCQTPICLNDGIEVNGVCKCEAMFTGIFCEQAFCEPPYPAAFTDKGMYYFSFSFKYTLGLYNLMVNMKQPILTMLIILQSYKNLVVIYGRDELGANIRRTILATGVSTRPIPLPPPARCHLENTKQDTLFIIDASLKEDNSTFEMLKHFAIESQLPYRFGPDATQVAAMTLADRAVKGFTFNSTEQNFENVENLLNNLTYIKKSGQNISDAFALAVQNYNSGYRTNPDVNHLIIYITNTNPTDSDPAQAVISMKRSGTYGVAVVALDMKPSTELLEMVNSRCLYVAPDYNSLMNYGKNFIQQLSCSHRNYCGI